MLSVLKPFYPLNTNQEIQICILIAAEIHDAQLEKKVLAQWILNYLGPNDELSASLFSIAPPAFYDVNNPRLVNGVLPLDKFKYDTHQTLNRSYMDILGNKFTLCIYYAAGSQENKRYINTYVQSHVGYISIWSDNEDCVFHEDEEKWILEVAKKTTEKLLRFAEFTRKCRECKYCNFPTLSEICRNCAKTYNLRKQCSICRKKCGLLRKRKGGFQHPGCAKRKKLNCRMVLHGNF